MTFFADTYDWWRAGHIIFVIFWMAGLLFLPRQFVYQFQYAPDSKPSRDLIAQQKRLIRIIMNPALILVWVFGGFLLISVAQRSGSVLVFLQTPWLIKLTSVSALTAIHMFYLSQHRQFSVENRTKSERFWRLMNEVPAILAMIIVITAVVFL